MGEEHLGHRRSADVSRADEQNLDGESVGPRHADDCLLPLQQVWLLCAVGTGIVPGHRVPHTARAKDNPMPVTEIQRTELINRLVEVLGEERAETLMQCILPEGRGQLATKDDLKALETTLRSEFKDEFAKIWVEFAGLRTELAEHKAETKAGFAEMRGYIDSSLAKYNRHHTFMLVGFVVTNWATMVPLALAT